MLLERMKAEGVALPDTLFMHRVLSRVAVDT
jgi:hypothetical protein